MGTLVLLLRRKYKNRKTHKLGSETRRGRGGKCSFPKRGTVTSLTNRAVTPVRVNPAHRPSKMCNLEEAPTFYTSQILQRARYHYNNYCASNFRCPAWTPHGKSASGSLCCALYTRQNTLSADGSSSASFLHRSVGLAHVTEAQTA